MEARVGAGFLRTLEELDERAGEDLPPRLRDMLRLRVSHLNGCMTSVRVHSESLAAAGVRPDLIASLARPTRLARPGLYDSDAAAALRLAEVLTDPPRGLEDEARTALAEFFDADQVRGVVETVALTNAWNRVLRGGD